MEFSCMYLLFDVIYELVNISHIIIICNIGAGSGQKLGKNWKCHLWKATLVKLQRVQTNFVPSKTKPRQQNK